MRLLKQYLRKVFPENQGKISERFLLRVLKKRDLKVKFVSMSRLNRTQTGHK